MNTKNDIMAKQKFITFAFTQFYGNRAQLGPSQQRPLHVPGLTFP